MKAIHGPDQAVDDRSAAARTHAQAPGAGREAAVPALVNGADPRLAHPGGAAAGIMALQRSAGNAAVAALVGDRPAVQRRIDMDEPEVSAPPSPAQSGPAPATASPTQAGASPDGAGAVTSDGATTTINGAHITLAAPMTETAGVLRASTILADSVVAASYSPGAGNVW